MGLRNELRCLGVSLDAGSGLLCRTNDDAVVVPRQKEAGAAQGPFAEGTTQVLLPNANNGYNNLGTLSNNRQSAVTALILRGQRLCVTKQVRLCACMFASLEAAESPSARSHVRTSSTKNTCMCVGTYLVRLPLTLFGPLSWCHGDAQPMNMVRCLAWIVSSSSGVCHPGQTPADMPHIRSPSVGV